MMSGLGRQVACGSFVGKQPKIGESPQKLGLVPVSGEARDPRFCLTSALCQAAIFHMTSLEHE